MAFPTLFVMFHPCFLISNYQIKRYLNLISRESKGQVPMATGIIEATNRFVYLKILWREPLLFL